MTRLVGATLAALALIAAPALAVPPAQPDPGAWVPDGPVSYVVHKGTTTYLGGFFNWIGPWTGAGVSVGVPGGAVDHSFPIVGGGAILTAVPDTAGGVYIGGTFTTVGGQPIARLAHISASGSVIATFNPAPDGQVTALALGGSQGLLYVAGNFGSVGGEQREGVAALNPLTAAVSDSFAPCLSIGSGQAYASSLALSGSTVYVGGSFDNVGGGPANPATHKPTCSTSQNRANLFAANTSTGAVLTGFHPDPGGGEVDALALSPDLATLYLGGKFGYFGNGSIGNLISRLGAVDAVSGALDKSWQPQPGGDVYALATSGSTVYAGGDFNTIGDPAAVRGGVAQLAGVGAATASATSFDAGLQGNVAQVNPVVRTLVLDSHGSPTQLAIGGVFKRSGAHDNLVLAAPQSGAIVNGFAPQPGGQVNAAAFISAGGLYAGGSFVSVGAVPRAGIVALDGYGHPTPAVFAGAGRERQLALSPDGATIYATGDFGAGAWSTSTGAQLPWNPVSGGIVTIAVAPDGKVVYIGGGFTSVGGVPRAHLAAVSPSTGAPTPWRPDPDGFVNAIVPSADGKTVYVGGSFNHVGTSVAPRSNLAAISASSGDVTPWAPDPNGQVTSLALAGDGAHIFTGGTFSSIGAQPQARTNVAELTTSTANPTPFAQSSSPNSSPDRITPTTGDSVVYLSGMFDSVGGSPAPASGALDGGSGDLLSWTPVYHGASLLQASIDGQDDTAWTGNWGIYLGDELRPYYAQYSTTPASIGPPSLSAAPRAGVAVDCVSGGWRNAPSTIAVAWKLDGGAVPGTTAHSFTPRPAQAGHQLSCQETAANPGGSASASSSGSKVAAALKLTLKATANPRRFHAKKGTRLRVTLSAAANLRLTLTKIVAGRRVKGRCKAVARPKKAKRCTARQPAGSLSWQLAAGASKLKLIGPRGRKLSPGTYTATLIAVAGKLHSAVVTIGLTVLR